MEQFNPLDSQSGSQYFTLSPQAIDYIESGSKWAKFLAILGFIGTGFIAFFLIIGLVFTGGLSSNAPFGDSLMASMGLMILFYGIILVINFFFALYLYRFADKLSSAVSNQSNELFEEGFMNYKRFFKMVGIMTIVLIGVNLLIIPMSFIFMDGFSPTGF